MVRRSSSPTSSPRAPKRQRLLMAFRPSPPSNSPRSFFSSSSLASTASSTATSGASSTAVSAANLASTSASQSATGKELQDDLDNGRMTSIDATDETKQGDGKEHRSAAAKGHNESHNTEEEKTGISPGRWDTTRKCDGTGRSKADPTALNRFEGDEDRIDGDSIELGKPLRTKMKVVHGDLVKLARQGKFDVIVHGCNCHCAMGSGIAATIKKTFPQAYAADCRTKKGDRQKLGTISVATITEKGMEQQFVVVNGYTQFRYWGKGVLADYNAVRNVMAAVKSRFSGFRIGYPRIGAGSAGGDWTVISQIIEDELQGEDHTLVEYMRSR